METLFSQYKYAAGGRLDSSNYPTARAACLVKSAVAQSHHSGKGYRDTTLHSHLSEEKVQSPKKVTLNIEVFEL